MLIAALAESGYAPLNPSELIGFLHPQLALLSVAPADKTGLPSPDTIQALEGYNLLRTDHNGWIELTTDGRQGRWGGGISQVEGFGRMRPLPSKEQAFSPNR